MPESATGALHRQICSKILDDLGKWQFVYGVGTVAPLCNHVCWHSCSGEHQDGQDDDSFSNCPQPECAASECYNFLIRECDPIQHAMIDTRYKEMCSVAPPSPPSN